jgi:HEAT repeat protein
MPQPVASDLQRLVDDIAAGNPVSDSRLALLSELEESGRGLLAEEWERIPAPARADLLEELVALADERIELNFEAVARVALGDPEAQVRQLAIEALGESTDRQVGGELVQLLEEDPQEAVRASAAAGLRAFALMREFDSGDIELGDRVIDALRARYEDRTEAVNVRGAALEAVSVRALPWVPGLITDAYYDDDRELRLAALRAMGSTADTRWFDLLEDDLQSGDPDIRSEAAIAVGEIADESGVDLLAPLLGDEVRSVVTAALQALGTIAGEEATDMLRTFVAETEDVELRAEAMLALELAAFIDESGEDGPWDE